MYVYRQLVSTTSESLFCCIFFRTAGTFVIGRRRKAHTLSSHIEQKFRVTFKFLGTIKGCDMQEITRGPLLGPIRPTDTSPYRYSCTPGSLYNEKINIPFPLKLNGI